MKKIHLLPNLLTLANSFCGLLAICKGIDALAYSQAESSAFYSKIGTACWLIFLGMLFDALDGKVARMVGGSSKFGAELDSFSDMLTFGVAPALLVKVLIEHDGPIYDYTVNPRLHFVAAAFFATMAMLRLARFNLESEPDESAHQSFKGLPSPAAAGSVSATMLMYVTLRNPSLETSDGTPTPVGSFLRLLPRIEHHPDLMWFLPGLALMLPAIGLLMVSRVRYVHMFSAITGRGQFVTLVGVVFTALCLFVAPVLAVFVVFNGYVVLGVLRALRRTAPSAREKSPGAGRVDSSSASRGESPGVLRAQPPRARATPCFVALGSNLGDRARHLDTAVDQLRATAGVKVLRVSSWIENAAVGGPPGQPAFLNGALGLETTLSARELLRALQAIERAHGRDRDREVPGGPRTLDLDLLTFDGESIATTELTVPHPRMEGRWFVMAPLAEIAPEFVLPRSRERVADRLRALEAERTEQVPRPAGDSGRAPTP